MAGIESNRNNNMESTSDRKAKSLSGFQDIWGSRMARRVEVTDSVTDTFVLFGFQPQSLPSLHYAEALGKNTGIEEKMVYNFRDNGDRHIALRFDHTAPLRNFIEQHYHEISLPYKRYELGNVWRADRPAKGRFREFAQMDADIVGSNSVESDVEMVLLVSSIMKSLGIDATIQLNSREIFEGLIEECELSETSGADLLRIIDKFSKIGLSGVAKELEGLGFNFSTLDRVKRFLSIKGDNNDDVLNSLEENYGSSEKARSGIHNLRKVISLVNESGIAEDSLEIDPTIARGLDYYTGIILETRFNADPSFGSICSGGRYDKFIRDPKGSFIPSIGVSIGLDRLMAATETLQVDATGSSSIEVSIINFGEEMLPEYIRIATSLRECGIATEVNPGGVKIKKQLSEVSKKGIKYSIFIGSDELSKNIARVKNMESSEELEVPVEDLPNYFRD